MCVTTGNEAPPKLCWVVCDYRKRKGKFVAELRLFYGKPPVSFNNEEDARVFAAELNESNNAL